MNNTPPTHHSPSVVIFEFFSALFDSLTYSPSKNIDFVFGLLWGLPVPFFAAFIYKYATGGSCSLSECMGLFTRPLFIFFALHPLLFAVVFGATGTMRARRDEHIRDLLANLEKHCNELCRANEKLTELDRLKSEFLANVTHELKSPLVTSLGYTDRILGGHLGPLTDRQRKGMEVSKRNLIRLRSLIDEILDFSRLEAGVAGFEIQPVDFAAAASNAVENLSLRARERNITLKSDLPASALVLGNHPKLMQVVINLVDNAIKFSPDGADVRVELKKEGEHWHLKVIDKGPGIPPEMIPKIFERFFQVDGSLSRAQGGVGLGLVVVKKIVEAHNGEVRVESTPGEGTTMHVALPAARLAAATGGKNSTQEVAHAAIAAD